ncbi:MAG: sigma-70 family RNA polymerase sigma factor [Clostridia bacterium]|nr:sigma-70 family RNA polymerase sigma factor [Clostridia bacterium]
MTRAIPVSPLFILIRNAALFFASLSSVRFETETDTALVKEKAAYYFDLFGNTILRLAYSYLHNTEDSEDVLQETLIQFIRSAPRFQNDRHAKAWLMRVTANLSKNRIGYNKTRLTDELNDELIAEEREDLSFVWQAVKELPLKQREVIHLFYQEGYSTAEIARILSRNESTVRSNLKRGRDALRTILKEAYDFE